MFDGIIWNHMESYGLRMFDISSIDPCNTVDLPKILLQPAKYMSEESEGASEEPQNAIPLGNLGEDHG